MFFINSILSWPNGLSDSGRSYCLLRIPSNILTMETPPLLEADRSAVRTSGVQTGAGHDLRLEGRFRPLVIKPARPNLFGEIAKAIGLLRIRVAVAVFCYCDSPSLRFDPKVASIDAKIALLNHERRFVPGEGQNKIRDFQVTVRSTDITPLLVPRHKRAIKGRRHTIREQ